MDYGLSEVHSMDVIHGANPLETLVLEDAELRKLYPGKILCQSPVSMPEWGETRGVGSTSWDRLFEATKRIAAQYSPSTVLLVTHGDAIGACICMCVYVCVHVRVHMRVRVPVCTCVRVCLYLCVCVGGGGGLLSATHKCHITPTARRMVAQLFVVCGLTRQINTQTTAFVALFVRFTRASAHSH